MHRRPRPSGSSGVRGRHARLRGALLRGGQAIGPRRPAHRHRPGRGGAHRGRREAGNDTCGDRPELALLRGNFGDLDELLASCEIPGIDAILFDLGVSSVQIDTQSRGFSFKENGPLDMRMDPGKQTLTAEEIVNTYNAADLTRIIRSYSDEKWASRIADFIVKARADAPITESGQLVDVIKAAIPPRRGARGDIPPSAPSKPFGLKSTRS